MRFRRHEGVGDEEDVVAEALAERGVHGRIVVGVAAQHRRVIADLAQRADDDADILAIGRQEDHVGLLAERLQPRELRGEVVVAVGVGVLEKDFAADRRLNCAMKYFDSDLV